MSSYPTVFRIFSPTDMSYGGDELSAREVDFLEEEINGTSDQSGQRYPHEPWIAAPFRYPIPVGTQFQSRLVPAGSTIRCFYAADTARTCAYESAYHFMRFRLASHTSAFSQSYSKKMLGSVKLDLQDCADIKVEDPERLEKSDYSLFHNWSISNKTRRTAQYASLRDPSRKGYCYGVFRIERLSQRSEGIWPLYLTMDPSADQAMRYRSDFAHDLPEQVRFSDVR